MKRPLLILFGAALFWLATAAVLGLLVDASLLWPGLLDSLVCFSYGRLRPAVDGLLLYGWACQASLAVLLWLLSHLGGSAPRSPALLLTTALLWNTGLLLGVCGILLGNPGAMPGFEFPGYAATILSGALLLFGVSALFLVLDRTRPAFFVSQWYLLAGLVCFPWLYLTAQALLVWWPIPGSAEPIVAAWYQGGVFWLWLVPVGLASAYCVVATLTSRAIHAYPSSVLAFRCLVFLGGWMGLARLMGGPAPAWMVSASVAASLMMVIPIVIIGLNLFGTLRAAAWPPHPALPFVSASLLGLFVVTAQGVAWPVLVTVAQFSDYLFGEEIMRLLGFATLGLFGALFFILPSLSGAEIPAFRLRRIYRLSVWSIGLMFAATSLGGLWLGPSLSNLGGAFSSSIHAIAPFRIARLLGDLGFATAALYAAWSFFDLLAGDLFSRPPARAAKPAIEEAAG